MLTQTTMGLLGLAILWVNTLLVAATALRRVREIVALRRDFMRQGLHRGHLRSVEAASEDTPQAVATLTIEQVGRWGAGKTRSIVWHDRSYASQVGACTLDGTDGTFDLQASNDVWVWLAVDKIAEAAACPSPRAFDAAYGDARKARGFVRKVQARVEGDREVWISGELARATAGADDASRTLTAPKGRQLLVATIDPLGWCRSRVLGLGAVFVPTILSLAAAITGVALQQPYFGPVSMVGGALALGFFLLVLPAGTAARDWARSPHERIIRGRWEDPNVEGEPVQQRAA